MPFTLQTANNTTYLECDPTDFVIRQEQDSLDLVAACLEHGTDRILLYASNFSAEFFDLKSRLAGAVLQKLVNYRLKGAGVIPVSPQQSDRFRELILESNRGNLFRFFEDKETAVQWLTQA